MFRIRKATTPHCRWCPAIKNDPNHTLFSCDAFDTERRELNRLLGKSVGPEDVEKIMCGEEGLRWLSDPAL